jgi:gamma-glutamylcyclotransferase (GGCT)/AIG2-like uncharacterized protein YtfP
MDEQAGHILFYGSLRRGEPAFERLELGRRLAFVRPVRFEGAMYDLGDYPGVVLEPSVGRVHGELHRILDASAIADLDDYELFRPTDLKPYDPVANSGSLFVRKAIRIGAELAYVYVLNLAPGPYPRVPGGDWLRRQARRRTAPS